MHRKKKRFFFLFSHTKGNLFFVIQFTNAYLRECGHYPTKNAMQIKLNC